MLALAAPLAAAVLAVAPAPPPRPAQLLVLALDLEAVNIEPATARAIDRLVVAALGGVEGLQATSLEDLRTLANLEAAKQAADCAATTCLAELAGALGARAVLFGSVTGLGSTISVALSLYDSKTGMIKRRTIESRNVDDIPIALRPELRELFIDAALLAPAAAPEPAPLLLAGIGTATLGGLALVGGAITTTVCELQLQDGSKSGSEREPLQLVGRVSLVAAGVGAAVGAVGAVLLLLPEGA